MRTNNSAVVAWVAVLAAVAAWTGVFMYASWISSQQDARSSQAMGVQDVSAREIADIKTHVLARDTKNLRAQLDNLTQSDVISIANTIDNVGKIAGVKLNIGAAISESAEQKKDASAIPALNAISFVVEADGTFATIMHAAELIEVLPLLSSVQSLEFEHTPSSVNPGSAASASWHLVAHVRILTSADISS